MNNEPENKPDFVIADRTLIHTRAESLVAAKPLTALREQLTQIARMQRPDDFEMKLLHLQVLFRGGMMLAQPVGVDTPPMRVTQTASHHLAREVLPARFFSGLRQLALMDNEGAQLAEKVWAKFSRFALTPRVVRVVNMRLGATVQRVVRAVTSTEYAPYSNLCYVSDMAAVDELTQLPVLNFRLSDDGMVVRISVLDSMYRLGLQIANDMLDHQVVPVISAWNSETGCRRVGLRAGLWKVKSGAVINHWLAESERTWVHRGRQRRMTDQIQATYHDQLERVQEVAQAYEEASRVEVGFEPALTWLDAYCAETKAPDRFKLLARAVLSDDKTIMPGYNLASIVDSLAIAAQQEADFFMSDDMSQLASQALVRGLKQYRKHGSLLVPEETA